MSLACRRCNFCVRRIVVSICIDFLLFRPVARCASVLSHRGWLHDLCARCSSLGCGVQLFSSLPSCLKQKKIALFSLRAVVTIGVITHGIRAGSTRDLGTLRISLI
jgi:hypothetical protein